MHRLPDMRAILPGRGAQNLLKRRNGEAAYPDKTAFKGILDDIRRKRCSIMVLNKLIKNEYDVVVVGAGPAGSTTAERSAERGLSVLLLEKRQEIGAPVRCGEGVSQENIDALGMTLPSHVWRQRIKGAYVYAPNGKEIKIQGDKTDGYVLERKAFDKWLAENASRKGAMIMTKATVNDLFIEKTTD